MPTPAPEGLQQVSDALVGGVFRIVLPMVILGGIAGILLRFLRGNSTKSKRRRNVSLNSAAPLCPLCGADMVRRTAKKGPHAGTEFWGCSQFPKCKGIIN